MKRLFEAPIRTQLFLMAVLMVLPAAGIILHNGLKAREEAITRAHSNTQGLVDNISYQQQSLVASARQLLSGIAQLPEVRTRDRDKLQPIIADILALNPQYLNIAIGDRRGDMWLSAVPSTDVVNIADRRHFINAMATGRFSSGEAIVSRFLGIPTIVFAYPFKDKQGEWDGVIVANFDLRYCEKLLANSRMPKGSNFLLTDYRGVVLSRGVNPIAFIGKSVPPDMMRQMQDGPEVGSLLSTGFLDDVRRFVTYRKLFLEGEETPYMYVRGSIPVEAVLKQANQALFVNLALLSSVLLFGVAAAWVVGKRSILERVTALQRATRRLAEGDFRVRVSEIVRGGELGSLGESFDAMAAELQGQRESLEAKALVLEKMAEGVFEFDHDGRILFANAAFDAMFGYGTGELLGNEMGILLEEPDGGDLVATVVGHLRENPRWCGELRTRRKNGSFFHTLARISEIRAKGRFVGVLEDITERKKLEWMKEEMICTVSHEMRTPLTALLGYNEFLLENEIDEAALKDSLSTMYKETNRLDELIGNFLDLQGMQARKLEYSFESLNVSELFQETADIFLNPSCKHRIIIDCPPDLPLLNGDRMRLHQMLNNLVSNAVKYSPGGGDIVLGARRECAHLILLVKDCGIGIPAEEQERIFDRFYRADNSQRGHFPGTGLGLALVQEIVHTHSGVISVESAPGKGSTFYVSLPVALPAAACGE